MAPAIKGTHRQLEWIRRCTVSGFTNSYSARLGAGCFGAGYKGVLPNGLTVVVKRLLSGHDDKTSQEQFMAEVGTIGRTHRINLVKLFGFCYDADTRRAIIVGVARGLWYLHEGCQHKIVHYDIKPDNVLLDGALTPKVSDFGLARLLNRADTHKTVSGMRDTPWYAAPEMWMQAGASDKCDVYSFGILVFEILGWRRNFDEAAPESRHWFPKLAWTKYESGELMEAMESCDGTQDVRGGVLVRATSAGGEAADERGGEGARGRDGHCSAGQPVPASHGNASGGKPVDRDDDLREHGVDSGKWWEEEERTQTADTGGECKKTATLADGWVPSDAWGQDDVECGGSTRYVRVVYRRDWGFNLRDCIDDVFSCTGTVLKHFASTRTELDSASKYQD
ncbi:G-type lectin S-receptor-like serine/threonine-protein kinase SD2-5 [Hordeum vulgare]|nr:G-type lectin S-receptor-like serine/threonine-protein kinase SD2-5 [Hordeum vulgare]